MMAVSSSCSSLLVGLLPPPCSFFFNFNNKKKPSSISSPNSRSRSRSRINALFWGSKKENAQQQQQQEQEQFSFTSTLTLANHKNKEDSDSDWDWDSKSKIGKVIAISVRSVASISEIAASDWDACAQEAAPSFNPFLSHAFLSSLEISRSAVKETGWMPRHLVATGDITNNNKNNNNILAVVPLYLKTHSYGEFVFDHSWANAYYSYGSAYYPKLQCCVPFTPVSGPRILIRNLPQFKDQLFNIILSALKHFTAHSQVSSLHVTFPHHHDFLNFTHSDAAFLPRIGLQYHWKNRNYNNFDDFLMDMKQSKRKNIRQERKKISAQNLTMKRLRGYEIKARHWDSFYSFYRNTTDNKWGTPYLTREFFQEMGSKMGDHVLLVVAEDGDELVAGALNLIGGDTLFGRLWGCQPRSYYPSLHFEACYYQAIEAAIELNLKTVEAGAQGEHKIQRGYLPVTTYSCHYLVDEEFRKAIQDFLIRESSQVKHVMKLLHDSGPFKDGVW